jgi:hypothetical protein
LDSLSCISQTSTFENCIFLNNLSWGIWSTFPHKLKLIEETLGNCVQMTSPWSEENWQLFSLLFSSCRIFYTSACGNVIRLVPESISAPCDTRSSRANYKNAYLHSELCWTAISSLGLWSSVSLSSDPLSSIARKPLRNSRFNRFPLSWCRFLRL